MVPVGIGTCGGPRGTRPAGPPPPPARRSPRAPGRGGGGGCGDARGGGGLGGRAGGGVRRAGAFGRGGPRPPQPRQALTPASRPRYCTGRTVQYGHVRSSRGSVNRVAWLLLAGA